MKISAAYIVFHRLLPTAADPVNAVLLVKRSQTEGMHPGYWGLVGGTMGDREEPVETAVRKANEELGLKLTEYDLRWLCDVKIRRRNDVVGATQCFSSLLDREMDALVLQRQKNKKVEGEALGWFTAEEIHHLMVRPEDRIAVNTFFQQYGT